MTRRSRLVPSRRSAGGRDVAPFVDVGDPAREAACRRLFTSGTARATSSADGRAMATAGNGPEAGVDLSFRRFTTGISRRGSATAGVAAGIRSGACTSGLAAGARANTPCRAKSARGGLWTRSASCAGWAAISGDGAAPAVESALVRLTRLFGLPEAARPEREYAVIIGRGDKRVGMVVDRMRGQQEVVIKALDPAVSGASIGMAGATIMGDGRVVLILDVASLFDGKRLGPTPGALPALEAREMGGT